MMVVCVYSGDADQRGTQDVWWRCEGEEAVFDGASDA